MPKDVVNKINAAVRKVLGRPAVRKRIRDTGSLVWATAGTIFRADCGQYNVYKVRGRFCEAAS